MRKVPGLLGSFGANRQLSVEMGRCAMSGFRRTRFHLRMVRLGKMLADAPPGRCFACTRTFDSRESDAKIPESFCSKLCEDEFLREYFKGTNLTECDRAFEILTSLLGNNGAQR
jgi:hypothetical protein